MAKPIIAIVGRPNVGKSTLFNKLTGKRLAIVEDTPGVTRDRLYCECEWLNRTVMLVDTGGIEPKTDDGILSKMRAQANVAIETSAADKNEQVKLAVKKIDMAAQKGLMHKNTAARKKSALVKKLNAAQ